MMHLQQLGRAVDSYAYGRAGRVVILIPVFNDWEAIKLLVPSLDRALARSGTTATVLLVDDGASVSPPRTLSESGHGGVEKVSVLSLRANLGHQRAIAVGLAYIAAQGAVDAVVVMDADGEDAPEDVPRLLDQMRSLHQEAIVFAERTKRLETRWFRVGYQAYRLAHWLLTGIRVRVGNFSAIPGSLLPRTVALPELWNHYAAAIFRSRIPYISLPTPRAPRLAGKSHMNWASLIIHGLSALSVHGERIGVRVLMACIGGGALLGGIVLGFWAWMVLAAVAVPPLVFWVVLGGLAAVANAGGLAFLMILLILQRRATPGFMPYRDFADHVAEIKTLWSPGEPQTAANDDRRAKESTAAQPTKQRAFSKGAGRAVKHR